MFLKFPENKKNSANLILEKIVPLWHKEIWTQQQNYR